MKIIIGSRLHQLRQERNLSQREIERRSGLLQCYISRVEQGHTNPSLETLHRFAAALEVPLYRLFHAAAGSSPDSLPQVAEAEAQGAHARYLAQMNKLAEKLSEFDRTLVLHLADKLARRNGG